MTARKLVLMNSYQCSFYSHFSTCNLHNTSVVWNKMLVSDNKCENEIIFGRFSFLFIIKQITSSYIPQNVAFVEIRNKFTPITSICIFHKIVNGFRIFTGLRQSSNLNHIHSCFLVDDITNIHEYIRFV